MFGTVSALSGRHLLQLHEFAEAVAPQLQMAVRATAFHGNNTERQHLLTILSTAGVSGAALAASCIAKLDAGEFKFPYDAASAAGTAATAGAVTSQSYACLTCAFRVWDDLVFQYRLSVDADVIPAVIRDRAECWCVVLCPAYLHCCVPVW